MSAVRVTEAVAPVLMDQIGAGRHGRWWPLKRSGCAAGRVIQIGSAANPNPLPARAAHSAAKAALANLTVSLAKELAGTGITANTISPGPTLTDGFREFARTFARNHGLDDVAAATRTLIDGPLASPADRLARPDEIAALVALVASPLGASINGANLRIDGGFTPTVN